MKKNYIYTRNTKHDLKFNFFLNFKKKRIKQVQELNYSLLNIFFLEKFSFLSIFLSKSFNLILNNKQKYNISYYKTDFGPKPLSYALNS